jgi:tape measure domain-containing protein
MASKELTAKVKLDISDVESKLSKLENRIKAIQNALGNNSRNKDLETQLNKQALAAEKVKQATLKTQEAEQRLAQAKARTAQINERSALNSLLADEKLNRSVMQTQMSEQRLAAQKQKTNEATSRSALAQERVNEATARTALAQERVNEAKVRTSLAQERVNTQVQRTALTVGKINETTAKTMLTQERIATQTQKTAEATTKAQIAEQRLTAQKLRTQAIVDKFKNSQEQVKSKISQIIQSVRNWASEQSRVNHSLNSTSSLLGTVKGKLIGLINTYLGVMGIKSMVNTSDLMTSAENKLNYLNAQEHSGYNDKAFAATQESMDKMYVSAQKVRMGYNDMMSNVSKSMTLAGDAFQNNTDNAIRFQEVMAEAYAIGGASAAEMSSSMYQLIQALGAGTLAGDELRSVREGAPLAYKAIEEFAQGVYNTEESLKELGSQGKITSDMVVAAILDAEGAAKELDEAFKNTSQTFDQTWNQIKNAATKAFEPISNMLNDMLNRAIENGMIEKFETMFVSISKVIMIVFKAIANAVRWIADNWNWLQHILIGGLILYASYLIVTTTIAIGQAMIRLGLWLMEYWYIALIIGVLAGVVYVMYLWTQGVIDTANAFTILALIASAAFIIIGLAMNMTWLIWVGVILAILAITFYFFEEVCYGAAWLAGWIVNIVFAIVNLVITGIYLLLTFIWNVVTLIVNSVMAGAMFIGTIIQWIVAFIVNLAMACANSIVAISHNVVAAIINVGTALFNSIGAIAKNIGIAFENAFIWAKNAFWEFIADVLEGVSKLEPIINGMAKLIGKSGVDFGSAIGSARSKKSEYKEFVSVSTAWSNGMDSVAYKDVSDAWSSGWNTMEFANMGEMVSKGWNTMERASYSDAISSGMGTLSYVDPNAWGSAASNWGAGIKDSINEWGSGITNNISETLSSLQTDGSLLDSIGEKLGLDLSGLGQLPSANDPANSVGGSYKQPNLKDLAGDVGDISGNTGKIADSMELTEEDLKYLRDVANMEWKKEFTTATIKVDMSNYNTVNGDNDLDGIVTKLTDRLYEELQSVADGVYV